MNRLHKITKFSFIKKYYFLMLLLIFYGWYKNGILPFLEGYQNVFQMIRIILFPFISFGIGAFFDFICKNKEFFNCKFYGLLFSMLIPFQTNFWFYLIFLCLLLFIYIFMFVKKIDCVFNFVAIGKLLLILCLIFFHTYNYQNPLESSGVFQYSFLDTLLGHQTSGLFTSSFFILLISLLVLGFDVYYKKEIALYSYGIYICTLLFYTILKQDIRFFLLRAFSSSILFAFIFIATLSFASPYTKKKKFIYSLFLGSSTLLFSLLTNFQEGVYISIVFANFLFVFLPFIIEKHQISKKRKN